MDSYLLRTGRPALSGDRIKKIKGVKDTFYLYIQAETEKRNAREIHDFTRVLVSVG